MDLFSSLLFRPQAKTQLPLDDFSMSGVDADGLIVRLQPEAAFARKLCLLTGFRQK